MGKTLAVAGMPQANLLFLAALLKQVAMPFLLPGNSKFLLKEVSGKCPIYDHRAGRGCHNLFKLLPDKGQWGLYFSSA